MSELQQSSITYLLHLLAWIRTPLLKDAASRKQHAALVYYSYKYFASYIAKAAVMRHLLFYIMGLFFRHQQATNGETDFLGFEAFTRPNSTNDDSRAFSPPEKALRKAA